MANPITIAEPDADLEQALAIAGAVPDPEIPAIDLADLGVLRGVVRRDGQIVVRLTPTYTGCPATAAIALAVETALIEAGLGPVRVDIVLSPVWTTDDISARGRERLRAYGIAPPIAGGTRGNLLFGTETVSCPRCGSTDTTRLSTFGSTPCKALWRCEACREPFDYFKCL